jgi:hypothetical protein
VVITGKCNLVFRGEVSFGQEVDDVKQRVAGLFKVSLEKADTLFTGKNVVIKKEISIEQATTIQERMLSLGAITYIESADQPIQTAKPRPKIPEAKKSVSINQNSSVTVASKTNPAIKLSNSALSLEPIVEIKKELPEHDYHEETKEKFSINFSAISFLGVLFILIGLALMIPFSPYPDWVVRKGFAVGILFFGYGIKRFISVART